MSNFNNMIAARIERDEARAELAKLREENTELRESERMANEAVADMHACIEAADRLRARFRTARGSAWVSADALAAYDTAEQDAAKWEAYMMKLGRRLLADRTPEQRRELMEPYCLHCFEPHPEEHHCYCERDD